MSVQSELLDLADRYLAGHSTLGQVDRFIAERADSLASLSDDDPIAALAGLIDVTLSEMDDGLVDEQELRERVMHFMARYRQQFQLDLGTSDTTNPWGDEYAVSTATDSAARTGEGRAA